MLNKHLLMGNFSILSTITRGFMFAIRFCTFYFSSMNKKRPKQAADTMREHVEAQRNDSVAVRIFPHSLSVNRSLVSLSFPLFPLFKLHQTRSLAALSKKSTPERADYRVDSCEQEFNGIPDSSTVPGLLYVALKDEFFFYIFKRRDRDSERLCFRKAHLTP